MTTVPRNMIGRVWKVKHRFGPVPYDRPVPATDRYILAAYAKIHGHQRATYNRKRTAFSALCLLESRVLAGSVLPDEIVRETDRIVATLVPSEDTPDAHD